MPAGIPDRRVSIPVIAATPNHQNNKGTNHTCCSGDGVYGCGCRCRGCTCRYQPLKNESNRNAYTSEGGIDIPSVGTSDYDMRGSSLDSDISGQSQILNNSYEVQDPIHDRLATDNFHETDHMHRATAAIRNVTAVFPSDEEDEHPWRQFISPSQSLQAPSDDSSGMVFENMEGSSMMMEPDESDNGVASSLSHYESAFPRHSMTISQIITGTGESFPIPNNFLRLTPECRHERTRQMCKLCIHY